MSNARKLAKPEEIDWNPGPLSEEERQAHTIYWTHHKHRERVIISIIVLVFGVGGISLGFALISRPVPTVQFLQLLAVIAGTAGVFTFLYRLHRRSMK